MTRNSRRQTLPLLARLGLEFDAVLTRDDGPVKPDPAAIWEICRRWRTHAERVVVLGDYRFDLEMGRRAGAKKCAIFWGTLARTAARLGISSGFGASVVLGSGAIFPVDGSPIGLGTGRGSCYTPDLFSLAGGTR